MSISSRSFISFSLRHTCDEKRCTFVSYLLPLFSLVQGERKDVGAALCASLSGIKRNHVLPRVSFLLRLWDSGVLYWMQRQSAQLRRLPRPTCRTSKWAGGKRDYISEVRPCGRCVGSWVPPKVFAKSIGEE